VTPKADQRRRHHSFRTDLAIFLGVNLALAVTYGVLAVSGVEVHGMWVWPVVALLWAVRLFFEARARPEPR
jgi:hypothetical protein